ncbi:MAG TPA: Ldh family oxidoreductase [Hyphomicrobiaceae bacterium]|nr:Ldh family oxidoreductase [Hyphomicrobiaceae bacterium]
MGADQQGGRFAFDALASWSARVLESVGVAQDQSSLAANILVRTDARGFPTHGLSRLKSYTDKLRAGEVNPRAALTESFDGAFGIVNAGNTLGQVAGPFVVERAVQRTVKQPLAAYMLRDTGHLGALGMHALLAAEAGRVAMILQATPPVIALPGARGAMLGNNPLALAAPRAGAPPIVVDMSCSVAARGNILNAAREGRPIPEGWAVDAEGRPTTDAQQALLGTLLPAGGHKGLMLAVMVEVLAGSLSGAAFSADLNKPGQVRSAVGNLNALVIVINPDLMAGRDAYEAHIASWTAHYKRQGGEAARIPGERAAEAEADARRNGVVLAASIVAELLQLGSDVGVPFPDTARIRA